MEKFNHIELNNEVTKRGDNGFFKLEKDVEAIEEFLREVDFRTKKFSSEIKRLRYLVEENFYYNIFDKYIEDEILECLELAANFKFEFKSYMAASKFYKDYALKTNDKKQYLENFNQHVFIVAMYLADGDVALAKELMISMLEQRLQPATPTFLNSGRSRRGELVSCFLLEVGDSLNSINYIDSTAKQLSKIGGGVAINLSKLRARGESIKGIKGVAKGVIPVAKSLEQGFAYADQLGQRPGAGAVYLNIFHYDVLEFLDTKKVNADEELRLPTISTGIIVPSLFFDLARENKDFYMFGPHSIYEEYGLVLDDIDIAKYYDEFVANENIMKRKFDARDMLNLIAQTQLQSGYPYLMFKDNANKNHALREIGQVKMSNLCTEIFQLQETSIIKDYGEDDIIKRDISCNLASLNIVNVMESKKIKESIYSGMDALTFVSNSTKIKNAPGVVKANDEFHSVGLGAMNLNGYLAKNLIAYESEEAKDFANVFFMMMNYYTLERSMQIAKKRNETFKDFEKSDYYNGRYFTKYIENDYLPVTDKVKDLFEGIHIPTQDDWERLKEDVMKYGVYNAYRMAIAPNQSTSYIMNSTASIMPVVDTIEVREYGDSTTFYPMPYLTNDNYFFYKSAYDMDQKNILKLVSVIQRHVDQGISTILFNRSTDTTRDLAKLYVYAHRLGLKSLYYTRTRKATIEECISCSV